MVKTGKSAAIRLEVSSFKVAYPEDRLLAKVREALGASAKLVRFYYEIAARLWIKRLQSL